MRALLIALALAAGLPAAQARAHAMPKSTVVVQARLGAVELAVSIPLSELSAALGHEPEAAEAGRYIAQHAGVTGADGRAWAAAVRDVHPDDVADHPVLAATLVFTPPAGASAKAVRLRYDAVSHRIASHYVLVYRRDGGALAPLGRLQPPAVTLGLP